MPRTGGRSAQHRPSPGSARRRRRGVIGIACAVLAVVIGVQSGVSATPRPRLGGGAEALAEAASSAPPREVGSAFHGLWSLYDDAQRTWVLEQLRWAGVTSVRMDVSWTMLQPDGPDTYYRWGVEFIDHVIGMINAYGMKPLLTLWLTPPWANGYRDERVVPNDPADYARVANWAAARWRGKVVGWEIWNEPNSNAFMSGADPGAYARLLRAAYPAIKAADPEARVVTGGLEYNDASWVSRLYEAGAGGYFDVLATHPYQGIADEDPFTVDGTKWTLAHAAAIHQLMVDHGDGDKPIWFTEFGWSSHGDVSSLNWLQGVTEDQQAIYLAQAAHLVGQQMPYVTRMYWSSDRDLTIGDVQNQHYGLFRLDLTRKPAMWTLRNTNAEAR